MNDAEFARLYGEWTERTPADVAALLAGYSGTWWIAGGWALEAFSGVERPHEDIDPAMLRGELPILRRYLALGTFGGGQGVRPPAARSMRSR